jgi:hypothetical protein
MPGTSTDRQLLDDNVVLFGIIVNEEEHSSMGGLKSHEQYSCLNSIQCWDCKEVYDGYTIVC